MGAVEDNLPAQPRLLSRNEESIAGHETRVGELAGIYSCNSSALDSQPNSHGSCFCGLS